MPAQVTIVAGSTGTLYFQLLDSGVPIDLNDFTITLSLSGVDGVAITTTGDITVTATSAAAGIVYYTPDSTDLTAALSPFKARWVLTEDTGAVNYVPNAYRDQWDVVTL